MISRLRQLSSGARIAQRPPFDAGLGRQRREPLERAEVLGAAVRIAGVVERVDADDDGLGAEHFRPGHRQRQEDGVARRHIGRRDVAARRARDPSGSRRRRPARSRRSSTDGTSSSRCRATPSAARDRRAPRRPRARGPARSGSSARGARSPRALRHRAGGVGVEPAAEKQDRAVTPSHASRLRRPR